MVSCWLQEDASRCDCKTCLDVSCGSLGLARRRGASSATYSTFRLKFEEEVDLLPEKTARSVRRDLPEACCAEEAAVSGGLQHGVRNFVRSTAWKPLRRWQEVPCASSVGKSQKLLPTQFGVLNLIQMH